MPAANGNSNGNAMVTTSGGQVIEVKRKTSKNNNDANGSSSNGQLVGKPSRGEDEIESRRASSRGLIPKAKVKTVKMTFVIIFVFILCWGPYIGFDLLQVSLGSWPARD